MEHDVLCEKMETVTELTYEGDNVTGSRGCKVIVTVRARFGLVRFRECVEQICWKRFPLKQKWLS